MFFKSRKDDKPAAAAGGSPGQSASPGRAGVQYDRQRQGGVRRHRSAHAAGAVPARATAPDRHARGLRHQPVRRLRGASGRPRRQVVHGAGRLLRRRRASPPSRAWRKDGELHPDAGGLPPAPRPAVRLLHARHDHGGVDLVNRKGGNVDEAVDPRGAGRQHLPLYGLPQHRRRRARRRRRHGQHAARPPNSAAPQHSRRHDAGNDRSTNQHCKGGAPMAETGIGASVTRKEDQRFITGKGQYTDDINRPGQTWAVFVRSPHAHANIKQHRRLRGAEVAGLPRRLHRRGHRQGQGRRPDLRLDDPFQGRLADEGRRRIRRWRRARCATSATTWRW